MAFGNDIVGGTALLRPAIRSPNYLPGVQGWTINRDGTSEFAGSTFRGAVVIIDPSTGNILATIGANGNGSFQYVYATNDVIIGNLSVLQAISHDARGIITRHNFSSLPVIPAGSPVDICWIGFTPPDTTRQYALRSSPLFFTNTNGAISETYTFNWILTQGGLATTIYSVAFLVPAQMTMMVPSMDIYINPQSTQPATIKMQAGNSSGSTTYAFVLPSVGWDLWVEDIGAQVLAGGGGTGSPTGTQSFTTKYFATASQAYDSSFNSESDPNNLYIGQLSGRSHGSNENSLWCFNGAQIRSDLSGASNISGKLWMYCTNSSATTGSVYLSWMTNTTPPSTITTGGSDGHNHTGIWPVPGWASVDITSYINSDIITGAANAAYLQSTGLTGSASWYGAGNSSYMPYLEIAYSK